MIFTTFERCAVIERERESERGGGIIYNNKFENMTRRSTTYMTLLNWTFTDQFLSSIIRFPLLGIHYITLLVGFWRAAMWKSFDNLSSRLRSISRVAYLFSLWALSLRVKYERGEYSTYWSSISCFNQLISTLPHHMLPYHPLIFSYRHQQLNNIYWRRKLNLFTFDDVAFHQLNKQRRSSVGSVPRKTNVMNGNNVTGLL